MRILITGGAGFIGSHLARRLVAGGHEVRVLDNLSTGRRSNLDGVEADIVEGDVRDVEALEQAMRGVEAVIHMAAQVSVELSWTDPVSTFDVNTLGTANTLEAAGREGVRRFVYASSAAIYGDQPPRSKSESLRPRPQSPYAHSKLAGEQLALAYGRWPGMRTVALRYFNVFGPYQDWRSPYASVIPLLIRHSLAGSVATIHGDGRQSRDFTYIDNAVDANLLALDSELSGVAINCACGIDVSLLDLVETISLAAGRPLAVTHDAARPGDIRESLADLQRAREMLGYEPKVDFADGLRRTYEWYRAAG